MSQPYIGTIQLFAFNFPPKGWATCDGQIIAINTNQALFAVLGTTYGGNGINTFALPDLRGRSPICFSPTYPMGNAAGEENHVLALGEMPVHNHPLMTDAATDAASNSNTPTTGSVLGKTIGSPPTGANYTMDIYRTGSAPNDAVASQSVGTTGNSAGHENRMPYLVMNFCIALTGLFPPRN